jgi:hypothetical protein
VSVALEPSWMTERESYDRGSRMIAGLVSPGSPSPLVRVLRPIRRFGGQNSTCSVSYGTDTLRLTGQSHTPVMSYAKNTRIYFGSFFALYTTTTHISPGNTLPPTA